MNPRTGAKSLLRRFGYELRRVRKDDRLGVDPFRDLQRLCPTDRPVVIDAGANVGQTVELLRKTFRAPVIHSFEPTPEAFAELQRNTAGIPDLSLNPVALGAKAGSGDLIESSVGSPLNSLLEPSVEIYGGGGVKGTTHVDITTVDAYCESRGITSIDLLKTDTQGYDFEVIKGAEGLLRRNAVRFVLMEVLFGDMYKGQPRMDEVCGYLLDHGFNLVSFYPFAYHAMKASWSDALFIHPGFVEGGRG